MLDRILPKLGLVALLALPVAADAQATSKPVRIRGEIVSLTGDALVVHRKAGAPADTVTIELAPDATVSTVKALRLQDIAKGSFVGATSTPDADGRYIASEVHVFPEAARGSGEGHYEWDLGSRSTMTNANVDLIVEAAAGRELKLSYKGGTKTITVPEGTPIVTGAPAARSDLVVGRRVFLIASPRADGQLGASRLTVEKDGVAPPF